MPVSSSGLSAQYLGAFGVVALLVVPTSGVADLSPEALWQEWQSIAAAKDLSIAVERREEGAGRLTLFGLTAQFDAPIGSEAVTLSAPEMQLRATGNDSVTITTPQGMRLLYTADEPSEVNVGLTIDSKDLTITASGEPTAVAYDWQAPDLTVRLDEATLPGLTDSRFDYSLDGFSGSVTGWTADTEPGQVDIVVNSDTAALDYLFAFEEIGREAKATSSSSGNVITFEIATPFWKDGEMLEGGSLTQRASAVSGQMRNEDLLAGERTVSDVSYEGSQTELTLTKARGRLQATLAELDAKGSNSSLPIPEIAFSVSGTDIDLEIPVSQGEAPQDASLKLSLEAIDLEEGLWNVLEPGGALARAPLSVQIDLDAKMLVGPTARLPQLPEQLESPSFRFTEVKLNLVELSYNTATVTGMGTVELLAPPPDSPFLQPTPVGQLDFTLQGIPELLEAVARSGLVPPQQMMGAQMFLGMFTLPQEDGSLKSRIEAKSTGELIVNGVRLR